MLHRTSNPTLTDKIKASAFALYEVHIKLYEEHIVQNFLSVENCLPLGT